MRSFKTPIDSRASLLVVVLLTASCAEVPAEDAPGEWRQWRGSGGRGISNEVNLPEVWSADSSNIRWKTPIPGTGNSSPIVTQGRVFVTTAWSEGEDGLTQPKKHSPVTRAVLGLDLKSGEVLWQTPIFTGPVGEIHYQNTHASATPASDGESIFVAFDGHLSALDLKGNILWDKVVDPDYIEFSHYGLGSSPIVAGNKVFLLQDREVGESDDIGWLAAFDKTTGEELWRHEWEETCCSYTTPVMVESDLGQELLMSTTRNVRGLDPETGEDLWQAWHTTRQPVPSLLVSGDIVLAPGGIHTRRLFALKRTGWGRDTQMEKLWEDRRLAPEISTPVYYKGLLLTVTRGGRLIAINLEDGKKRWELRMEGRGLYDPSLVAGDDKLYVTTRNGDVQVVSMETRRGKLLAMNELGEGTSATPAIAGGCLLIRGSKHLFCIEAESAGKS